MAQHNRRWRCWTVSDGRRGMENQVLGLAEALARRVPLSIETRTVRLAAPWRWMPYPVLGAGWPDPLAVLHDTSGRFDPPWPDVLIGCGRQAVPISLAMRRRSKGQTLTVQTQHPRIDPARFDLVLPPRHDGLTGPNVLPLIGAPHRVTRETLEAGGAQFADLFKDLPRPLAGVLIGGTSKSHRLDANRMTALAADLKALSDAGIGLAVTTSRRTGAENEAILRNALAGTDAFVWDGAGENPYFGLLAHADALLVTEDSTNMVTEAAATGKPVHILALDGGSAKFTRFHDDLAARGVTRPFTGRLESWTYDPLDETSRAAEAIAARLETRTAMAI